MKWIPWVLGAFLFTACHASRAGTTPSRETSIGGALAPSLTDVQAYRSMRGHFGYTSEDFDRLSAWD